MRHTAKNTRPEQRECTLARTAQGPGAHARKAMPPG
jgi:hypothetical protein